MLSPAGQLSVTLIVSVFSIILWSLEYRPTNATKTYAMEGECGEELSMIFDSVYQAKLALTPRTSSLDTCTVTIETWYSMPNLMFYFTNLNVSCTDGHIEFADGQTGGQNISGLEGRVCNSNKSEVLDKIFLTTSQFLRVKYTRTSQDMHTNLELFSVIFTAYSSGPCRNDQYQCSNGRCIYEDVKCNGLNSCGDNSGCKHELSSIATAGIVAASLVGLCILATIVVMVVYHCYCKKNHKNRTANRISYSNTRSIGHHDNTLTWHGGGTLSIVSGQQPAYPRNWSYSGHQGYNTASNAPVNVNTNIHCWFVANRNQSGTSNVDGRPFEADDDLDDNWTKDELINDNKGNEKINDKRDHKEYSDKSGEDNEVYIEDEVLPESEIDERVNANKRLNTHGVARENKPNKLSLDKSNKGMKNEIGDKNSDGLNSVRNMCGSGSENPYSSESGSNSGAEITLDSSDIKIRKARVNNDAFRLNDSEQDENKSNEDNGISRGGLKLNDSFESHSFSTDL